MIIHVHLHGALRDKLPPAAKGKAALEMGEDTAVSAILSHFSLRGHIQVAINQEITDNWDTILQDGDRVELFRPAAGG
jgi:molybdopterin converting factor small subunit